MFIECEESDYEPDISENFIGEFKTGSSIQPYRFEPLAPGNNAVEEFQSSPEHENNPQTPLDIGRLQHTEW